MQVDSAVYDWLKELKLVNGRVKQLQNQNIMISEDQAKLFQNGVQLGKLLTQITDNYNVISDVARIKNLSNPSTRVYNWNIIQSCLKTIDYKLDGEIKSLIVSGDNEVLTDLLKELYKTFKLKPQLKLPILNQVNQSFSQNNSSIRSINNEGSMSYPIDYYENQLINQEELNDPTRLDISQIDPNKKLSDCTSLLEFILVGLCKELNLKPKQAVSLLANNNKYLAVGLIKGMKTSFQPLCNWLQNIYVNIKTVLNFIEKEESDLFRFLDMIKPGLQSSSEQVALWSTRIISKIAFEVSSTDILPQTYQWFVRENGGLQSCVLCLKRHKVIKMNVVQIITQIAKYNLSDLFIVQMRKLFEDIKEYIKYISLIFPNLMEMQNYKEELLANRILDFWIEQSQKIADYDPIKNSSSDRQAALQLLCDCWITYPRHITDNLQVQIQILDLLKKGSRDFSQVLKFHSLQLLFVLLENFANQKNPSTALIYKKLTFSLIENSSDTNLREFILRNFAYTFKRYAQMPPDVLLDPFIKQIQLRSSNNIFSMNTCEVEFFTTISSHPGLNLKTAIQMIDMLSKMYLQDIIWSQSLFQSIKNLIDRFIENETFQEYTLKLSSVSLNMILNSYNQLLQQPGRFQQDYTTEQEQVIIEAQRRALIIELNKFILEREVTSLNKEIKDSVVKVQQDLLNSGIQYKGIYQLLLYFGDPDQIIQTYKDEQLAKQKDFEYNLFQMQQNQKSSTAHSDQDKKKQYVQKNSNDIDWGDAFESSPHPAKLKNYMNNSNIQPGLEGSPSMRQNNTNTYGANRMDFSQFEQTNLQMMNQMQRTREQNAPLDSRYDRDYKNQSIFNKNRAHQSLERRKEEIDKIREQRENKSLMNDLDKFMKYQKEQQLKKETEQEVNKIHTKLNVGKQKQTDQYAQLIYQEKELDTIKSLNKYKIVKIEELEQRDIDSLDIVMKQYANTFKFVFSRYSNIHKMFNKKNDLFQEQKNTSELISFGDVWNCCKDFDLQKFVSRDDVLNIMKQVNSNPQYTFLKYSDFLQFIVQLSIFMFSQPPKDLRGQPLGNQIRELFLTMALYKKNKGVNPAIFENPECFAPNLDVMTIKSWNNKLLKDPNTSLPENLKKVQEKSYSLKNNFDGNKMIGLSEGYILAYSILQDILKEKLNISIGESMMSVANILQARPKPIPSIVSLQKIQTTQPADPMTPQPSKTKANSMSVKDMRQLKNQNIYQSLWVEKYSEYGLPGLPKTRKVILNQAEKNRLQKEEEEINRQKSQDKKILQRKKEVEQQKEILEAFKAKKRQEELEKEQKKIQDMEKEKEKYQRQRLQQIAMKNELNKKQEEKKMMKVKQMQEEAEKQKELERKRREQIEANKQKVEFREGQAEQRIIKKKQVEDQKNNKEQERQASLQNKHKNLNEIALQKEQERKERENEFKYLFEDLSSNPQTIKIFQDNSRTLSTLFSLYKNYQDIKVKNLNIDSEQVDQLSYKGFYLICSHLKILPQIISSDEILKMYKASTRNNQEGQYGIIYEQFEELLLKIAIKGRPIFDEIQKYNPEDPDNQGLSFQDIAKRENRKLEQERLERLKLKQKNKEQDKDKSKNQIDHIKNNLEQLSAQDVQSLKLTTPDTLQGLIKYLELPQDKHSLFQYIKSLQGQNLDNKSQINNNSSIYGNDSNQATRGRNSSSISISPIRERTSSLPLQKKYPKSKKYQNVQSKYKSSVQGDPFTNKQTNQQQKSNSQIPK